MKKIAICLGILMLLNGCDFLEDVLSDGRFSIEEPDDGDIVNTEEIRLAGEFVYTGDRDDDDEEDFDDDDNLFMVEITVNDGLPREMSSSEDTVEFDISVSLEEGENTIELIGYYMDEEIRTKEISIELDTKAPKVEIKDSYIPPVTVSSLEFYGSVEYDHLDSLEYKTVFVDNSDPDNPVTRDSGYNKLPYEDSMTGETGVWNIDFQNISETLYVDENTVGDKLTVTVRSRDTIGNSATVSSSMTIFSPDSRVK